MVSLDSAPVSDAAALVSRNTEEVITEEDLEALVRREGPRRHYIGFEISGQVHLGTGIVCMSKVRDFQQAGFDCTVLLADWHSWINDKLGGDLGLIREVGRGYFQPALEASLRAVGGDPERVEFVLASDLYKDHDDYWATVVQVAKSTTLARMQRSITILGRAEGDKVDFAKLLYPAMQVADVYALRADLPHAGLDQRKAHVIARDVAASMTISPLPSGAKPVAVHHPLLLGLGKPPGATASEEDRRAALLAMKMSKSKPDTAVFVHDSREDVERKLRGAYCPPAELDLNPVVNWADMLVFRAAGSRLDLDRPEKFGGSVSYETYAALAEDYAAGKLHPMDLKKAVTDWLDAFLAPVREEFAAPERAAMVDLVKARTTS